MVKRMLSPTRYSHALITALAGAVLLLVSLAPTGAEALKRETCGGRAATIVSNDKVIVGKKAHDVIVAGSRDNRIFGQGGNDTICGGGGDDVIFGGRGSDKYLDGEAGNDSIDGERGKDNITGGGDADNVGGGRGSDEVSGGGGANDRVFGESGNDDVSGGDGDSDFASGGLGDDSVSGGGGDRDVILGDTGNDKNFGGGGRGDIASFATSTGPLVISVGAGTVRGSEHERLRDIDDVMAGSGDDVITGSPAANRLDGGPGDDVIRAMGSGDEAYGGSGSNSCVGSFSFQNACGTATGNGGTSVELVRSIDGSGSLVIDGNGDSDRAILSLRDGAYVVSQAGGGNEIQLGNSDGGGCSGGGQAVSCRGKVSNVLVSLGGGDDVFNINDLPRGVGATVDGGKGSDELSGGPSKDTLYGGDDRAPDRLFGGGGDDALFGVNIAHPRKPSGAGEMRGQGGNDLMIGGQPCGGDVFDGGEGANDSASFARVKNSGVVVVAEIGGGVSDPDVGACDNGSISGSTEKIEGSTGPDRLFGDNSSNVLLGRGGGDRLDGRGGHDRCIGGGSGDRATGCEFSSSID